MNSPTRYPRLRNSALSLSGMFLLSLVVLAVLATRTEALEIRAFQDNEQNSSSAANGDEQRLRNRINDMEHVHRTEIARLEARIEELEVIIKRLQQNAQIQLRKEERLAFEQRRSESWARVTNGMRRQDVYRLLGRGIKDTKSTLDCRCYTRGRVCFNEDDQSIKSELRCEL